VPDDNIQAVVPDLKDGPAIYLDVCHNP